jgi:hypothetical protein
MFLIEGVRNVPEEGQARDERFIFGHIASLAHVQIGDYSSEHRIRGSRDCCAICGPDEA